MSGSGLGRVLGEIGPVSNQGVFERLGFLQADLAHHGEVVREIGLGVFDGADQHSAHTGSIFAAEVVAVKNPSHISALVGGGDGDNVIVERDDGFS